MKVKKVTKFENNCTKFHYEIIFLDFSQEKLVNIRRHLPKISDFSDLMTAKNLSTQCENEFEVYLKSLDNLELWALHSKYRLEQLISLFAMN